MKTTKLLFLFLLGVLPIHAQESDVVYYEGSVTNQDGSPIAGAIVCIFKSSITGTVENEYKGITDADGHCSVKVEEGSWPYYRMYVEADGYPRYEVNNSFSVNGSNTSPFPTPKEIVLWNRLDFKKDQNSTILLPEAPDPSWGRFYRVDHLEGNTFFFVREEEPLANVPYVIFPKKDFSIDLNKYDLSNLPELGFVPSDDTPGRKTGLCGSYTSTNVYGYVLDDTPDCSNGIIVEGETQEFPRVGAFRAYLYSGLGTKVEFIGEPTFVRETISASTPSKFFDLQGRRIQGEPKHGVYIRNGKKVMR